MADSGEGVRSSDAEQRRLAVRDADSVDVLIEALGDDSWRVRKQAVDRLATWRDVRAAARALVDVLATSDHVGRRNGAIETLNRIGPQAVGPLARALGPHQPHRKFLIDALGAIGDPRAVPRLVRSLTDTDPNVKVAAAEALGSIGGDDAVSALLAAADTGEMLVQLSALDSLAQIGAVVPVERLMRWVATPVVRVAALKLLGHSREAGAVPELIGALGDKTRRAREAAIEALARFARNANAALLEHTRTQVAQLGETSVQFLARAVSARSVDVRRGAAYLLGLGKHYAAVPELAAGLTDAETGAACSAAIAAIGPAAVAEAKQQEPPPPGGRVEISAAEYKALRGLIYDHCGIRFPDDAAYLVRRRLAPRLNATGAKSYDEYCRMLRHGPRRAEEMAAVVDCITTNETYFFREAYQLRAFRDEILPHLHDTMPRGRRLDVWSAGCATGEEAYTIAMLILDAGGFEDWDVRVIGTDISQRVLSVARQGRYRGGSLRADELAELRRFVLPEDDGEHVVAEEVRTLVDFREVNLIDEGQVASLGAFDVVFCRNVLLYFDRAARERVVASFHERLSSGGYLLLGHSESLLNLDNAFDLAQLRNDTVYRKP